MNGYAWLAAQPPFVEVAIGVVFILLVAPVTLAAVAYVLARVERLGCFASGAATAIRLEELRARLLAMRERSSAKLSAINPARESKW